jgi:hypothetical protein
MKKTIIGTVAVVAAVALLRRYGPSLEQRAKTKCHEMMSQANAASEQKCACDPASSAVAA